MQPTALGRHQVALDGLIPTLRGSNIRERLQSWQNEHGRHAVAEPYDLFPSIDSTNIVNDFTRPGNNELMQESLPDTENLNNRTALFGSHEDNLVEVDTYHHYLRPGDLVELG